MNQSSIKEFINKNINLNPEIYLKVNDRYKIIKELLERKMDRVVVQKQGSMATKTAIKPINEGDEYDLDIAVVFKEELSPINHIVFKNDLFEILNRYNNVFKKPKCINVVWSEVFNGDFVVMEDVNNNQKIYNESTNQKIHSNNLNYVREINETFARSKDDAFRDAAKLIKYYLKRHKMTKEIVPSILINLIVASNASLNSPEYMSNLSTTVNSVGHFFQKLINEGKLLQDVQIGNADPIKTKIHTMQDMHNVLSVINKLSKTLRGSEMHKLAYDLPIGNEVISSVISEKPWKK